MQNGRKTNKNTRQPRSAASFAARSKRWSSNAPRPELKGSHNAQRNYERYLALARAEALSGNIQAFDAKLKLRTSQQGRRLSSMGRRFLMENLRCSRRPRPRMWTRVRGLSFARPPGRATPGDGARHCGHAARCVGYRDDGAWESGQSEGGGLGFDRPQFQAAESRGHPIIEGGLVLSINTDEAHRRAEALFKKEQQEREAQIAMAEYQAGLHAMREKTARLRALRLARDAANPNNPKKRAKQKGAA
jgi:hypothetical protein